MLSCSVFFSTFTELCAKSISILTLVRRSANILPFCVPLLLLLFFFHSNFFLVAFSHPPTVEFSPPQLGVRRKMSWKHFPFFSSLPSSNFRLSLSVSMPIEIRHQSHACTLFCSHIILFASTKTFFRRDCSLLSVSHVTARHNNSLNAINVFCETFILFNSHQNIALLWLRREVEEV